MFQMTLSPRWIALILCLCFLAAGTSVLIQTRLTQAGPIEVPPSPSKTLQPETQHAESAQAESVKAKLQKAKLEKAESQESDQRNSRGLVEFGSSQAEATEPRPTEPASKGPRAIEIDWEGLRDVQGQKFDPAQSKWKVVCFLGTECPLARLYGPRLDRLAQKFAPSGVQLVGINSNPQDSVADVKRSIQELKLSFPMIKDDHQTMAKRFGATRTPEVFVLDANNVICYQGRIDDQYEPGLTRSEPTQQDLRDALQVLIAGGQVAQSKTEPVGCLITFIRQPDIGQPEHLKSESAVTFARDVAPILNKHCVQCHRPDDIGPFALTEYEEVVGWGEMMLEVIDQGRMPPWHADPRYGHFVGARRLPQQAKDTLTAWVKQGMPKGDLDDLPPRPQWSRRWHQPTPPDVVLSMRDRPFEVPPEGTVEYQYFVVDPQWKEERWIRAAQVIPGNPSVVHHAIVFVRPPDGAESSGIGWLGGYVPGFRIAALPPGHARRIPAGSKLVFQLHYTPNGRVTEDVTQVGVWFSDPETVTDQVTTQVALNHHFEIPPRAQEYAVEFRLDDFAPQSRLLGVMPHMHLRGKSFRLDIRRGGEKETLLLVPNYDFNWQHWYQLETPLALEDVDSLQMESRFDNSSANPVNPDPQQHVTWGDQTWEEMAVAFLDVAHPRGSRGLHRSSKKPTRRDASKRQRQIEAETDKFLSQLDRNGDGVVVLEEAPYAFRRFGFSRIDQNRDGRLDRREIRAEAAKRF